MYVYVIDTHESRMKNILRSAAYVLILFISSELHGQGWQWGRGNTGGGLDAWSVATDPAGNIFVGGLGIAAYSASPIINTVFGTISVPFSTSTNNGTQSIIAKYDVNGSCLWAKGTLIGDSWPINITTDKNGNSFLFGSVKSKSIQIDSITLTNTIYPYSQYFLVKFDPSGNVVWAKIDGNARFFDLSSPSPVNGLALGGIATDAAGNIYITANFYLPSIKIGSYTLNNGGSDDIFVAKYDSDGNVIWATSSGGSGSDDAYGITVTPAGDIYIAGQFKSSSINFGPSIISNSTGGGGLAFVAKYNSEGTPEWASSSGGQGESFADGITSDAFCNIYLTGGMNSNISFNGTNINDPHPGYMALYLVKFDTKNTVNWYKTVGTADGNHLSDAWGYSIALSSCGDVWVSGSFSNPINIDGLVLNPPLGASDPVFIAGFSSAGVYAGSAALPSGADDQNGIACDAQGNVFLCSDYGGITNFVIGNDTLADVYTSGQAEWLYLAKYTNGKISPSDTFILHTDTTICPDNGLVLSAPPGFSDYLWNTGSTGKSLSINTAGTYWVESLGSCKIIDSINVTDNSSICKCRVCIPNTFTPNNDGKNDFFHPLIDPECEISDYYFIIFNRWGNEVFKTTDPAGKWDGKFMGMPAESGVYMYYFNRYRRLDRNYVALPFGVANYLCMCEFNYVPPTV